MDTGVTLDGLEMQSLLHDKQGGFNYRERRHEPWNETYMLYRDEVVINRLIQRQSVNVPLMKLSLQTNMKDADDLPLIYFENLDGDKQAELFKNEYWKYTAGINNFELQDIVDKKQEWLFGRTFAQWQVVDGRIKMTVQDPMDILVDRYCDPYDLNTSRFLIHSHVYVPISTLENDANYDQEAVTKLKSWYATEMGLKKAADNTQDLIDKNKKMQDLGVTDVDQPVLGETIVELSLHFKYHQEADEEEQIWLYVQADDHMILMKKKLEEVIGTTKDHYWRNHYPYDSWAGDLERQDFWSDGKGDVVRTSNKIVNSWLSQLVENRTLRNYGMNFYNASLTQEGWSPNTFQPQPFGWYPIPGNPRDVLQRVDIPDLSESLDEMNFVIQMVEKATGATSTQQGVQTERKITLGEVELALGQAQDRAKSWSKFYTRVWEQRGEMFIKLIEAAGDKLDAVTVYKKGKNSDTLYGREISTDDWASKSGYHCRVWSQDEKNAHDTDALQKLNAVKTAMPTNNKLGEVYNMKLLEFAGLTPEQTLDIMGEERKMREQMALTGQTQNPMQPAQPAQPQQPAPVPLQQ